MTRVRGMLKTRINTTLNRIVQLHRPAELAVERLVFRLPGLSRRMNRLVRIAMGNTRRFIDGDADKAVVAATLDFHLDDFHTFGLRHSARDLFDFRRYRRLHRC